MQRTALVTGDAGGLGGEISASPRDFSAAIPAGRLGTLPDIGRIAAFPAADEAGHLNGATSDANGDRSMG